MRSGWKPRADITLTFVVGELQGGVGTAALIQQDRIDRDDLFVNCEPSDLKAITMHAESIIFKIELTGVTRQ
jgi:acetylornithine deacetylase